MNKKAVEKVAVFFPEEKRAEGYIYEGGKTYLLHDTPGTLKRWEKRGCKVGIPNAKDALPDPRFCDEVEPKKKSDKKVIVGAKEEIEKKPAKEAKEKPVSKK